MLVGSASNYISQMRRDIIIRKLEDRKRGLARTLRSICKSHQPDGDLLFGSAVPYQTGQRRFQHCRRQQQKWMFVDPGFSEEVFSRSPGPRSQPRVRQIPQTIFPETAGKQCRKQPYIQGPAAFPAQQAAKDTVLCHEKSTQYQESVKHGIRHTQLPLHTQISYLYIPFPTLWCQGPPHVGGRLRFFQENWKRITDDGWILQIVTGCTLEFKSKPPLGPPALRERQLPKDQTKALEEEIIALVKKQAIKKLLPHLALRGFTAMCL